MSESDIVFNEQDRRCAAVQLMLSTNPSYDNRTIASTRKMQIWTVQHAQGDENKVSGYSYGLWCGFKWGPHHATSHLQSWLESKHQSVPKYTLLKSMVIPWCNQVAGGRPWVWYQHSVPAHKSKETQAWFQKECYDFVPFSNWNPSFPNLNPLYYIVWSYVENITNMTSHNTKASQPDRCHPLSIRRAPAGACGKGILPVPDQGSDWSWRLLHWIDVSSTI